MSDLVSRLLAAIAETERLAKACPCVEFSIARDPSRRGRFDLEAYAADSMTEFDSVSPIGGLPEVYARHIAHNDPAAVLRRCRLDRDTVQDYQRALGRPEYTPGAGDALFALRMVVERLGLAYGLSVEEETN